MKKKLLLITALVLLVINILHLLMVLQITGGVTGTADLCILGSMQLTDVPNLTATVGNNLTYALNCTIQGCSSNLPLSGAPNTFSSLTFPTLASFSLDSSSGIINFTPQNGEAGKYDVVVTCRRSGLTTLVDMFSITIQDRFGPEQLNISVYNNHSINITWSSVNSVSSYTAYYSSNISSIMNLSLNNIPSDVKSIPNIINTYWNDTNASDDRRRYYTVSATKDSLVSLTGAPPVGKFTYRHTILNSSVFGILASNRIVLYLNTSHTAESLLQEIPASLNPTISRLDKSNASGEYLTTHVRGLNDGNNFNLEPARGYQITVDANINHTVAGKIYNQPYTLSFEVPTSTAYGILTTNWDGIYDFNRTYTAESFLQGIAASFNPTLSQLNKSNASGEYLTTHVRGLNDGNNFTMDLGTAYQITVDNSLNYTLCTKCFD